MQQYLDEIDVRTISVSVPRTKDTNAEMVSLSPLLKRVQLSRDTNGPITLVTAPLTPPSGGVNGANTPYLLCRVNPKLGAWLAAFDAHMRTQMDALKHPVLNSSNYSPLVRPDKPDTMSIRMRKESSMSANGKKSLDATIITVLDVIEEDDKADGDIPVQSEDGSHVSHYLRLNDRPGTTDDLDPSLVRHLAPQVGLAGWIMKHPKSIDWGFTFWSDEMAVVKEKMSGSIVINGCVIKNGQLRPLKRPAPTSAPAPAPVPASAPAPAPNPDAVAPVPVSDAVVPVPNPDAVPVVPVPNPDAVASAPAPALASAPVPVPVAQAPTPAPAGVEPVLAAASSEPTPVAAVAVAVAVATDVAPVAVPLQSQPPQVQFDGTADDEVFHVAKRVCVGSE